ncbi:alpha/beta hydrolase [Ramlibacter sp. PS4R-6]|uniref:alpha/beta hydrolase n=1 Tax=Ramlibacter sp. PS4R-6 TaxID=3133438 RepID=UPI0030A19D4C
MKNRYDPAWLDRMYNNRELVRDYPTHLRNWAAWSADAMRGGARSLDVRYGPGPNEHLDIFRADREKAPVLVFIHGGYWRALDKKDHAFVAPPFTQKGVCVVVPNYALCPAVTIPDIVMQMVRALAWTWRHIGEHGGDRDRIFVAGHSAGGHLAAMMAACLWPVHDRALPADLVKGALSISGLHDLEPFVEVPFLKDSLQLTPKDALKASPAYFPSPNHGQLYSVSGALESAEFHRQMALMRDAWGKQRVPVCEKIAECNHFSVLEAFTQQGNRLHSLALELVQNH